MEKKEMNAKEIAVGIKDTIYNNRGKILLIAGIAAGFRIGQVDTLIWIKLNYPEIFEHLMDAATNR